MFDHIGFRVRDLEKREALLRCGGGRARAGEHRQHTGFLPARLQRRRADPVHLDRDRQPALWSTDHTVSASPIHVAFEAKDRAAVDAFYKLRSPVAVRTMARRTARPAETKYYGAYVLDPDGNNIEAGFRGK